MTDDRALNAVKELRAVLLPMLVRVESLSGRIAFLGALAGAVCGSIAGALATYLILRSYGLIP